MNQEGRVVPKTMDAMKLWRASSSYAISRHLSHSYMYNVDQCMKDVSLVHIVPRYIWMCRQTWHPDYSSFFNTNHDLPTKPSWDPTLSASGLSALRDYRDLKQPRNVAAGGKWTCTTNWSLVTTDWRTTLEHRDHRTQTGCSCLKSIIDQWN